MKKYLLASFCILLWGCGGQKAPPIQMEESSSVVDRQPTMVPESLVRKIRAAEAVEEHDATSPAPDDATPGKATLELRIKPASATIVLTRNGCLVEEIRDMPDGAMKIGVEPGRYSAMVSAPGYESRVANLDVQAGGLVWSEELTPVLGELTVNSSPDADVELADNQGHRIWSGTTDTTGKARISRLPEGAFVLMLSKFGYASSSNTVHIEKGKMSVLDSPLQPLPGKLRMGCPWKAEVWLDNTKLGYTDETLEGIPPGRHRIEIRKEGFRSAHMVVDIDPGRYVIKTAPALVPQSGALYITAEPELESENAAAVENAFFNKAKKEIRLGNKNWESIDLPLLRTNLSCGEVDVAFRAGGYLPSSVQTVKIVEDTTNRVHFSVQAVPASMQIESSVMPATVYKHNKKLGECGKPIFLSPFITHELEVRADGYHPAVIQTDPLRPGEAASPVSVTLKRRASIEDLYPVDDSLPSSAIDLAPGSVPARKRQIDYAKTSGLPVEAETKVSGIRFRLIPPGSVNMGSPEAEQGRYENEKPREGLEKEQDEIPLQYTARIPDAFNLGKYEVTQEQWERVMGKNPSAFIAAGPDAPVEQVSWTDCRQFIRRLCELEGVPWGTYRLPTEAEWEYACRAGTKTPVYSGLVTVRGKNNAPELDKISWYAGNSGVEYKGCWDSSEWFEKQLDHTCAGTHPVGLKQPNAWGCYDMIGNVWEWCADWYSDRYMPGTSINPKGPGSGSARVCRGGGWYSNVRDCRAARRFSNVPAYLDHSLGFRLVRKLPHFP